MSGIEDTAKALMADHKCIAVIAERSVRGNQRDTTIDSAPLSFSRTWPPFSIKKRVD